MKMRAYVHLVDGQVHAVYLLPETQATWKLSDQISDVAAHFMQPIANVIPRHCQTGEELVAAIREANPDIGDDE